MRIRAKFAVAPILLGIFIYVIANFSHFSLKLGLVVDDVLLSGLQSTTPGGVLSVAGIKKGTAMIDVDIWQIKSDLETKLPWVKHALVARRFPNTIAIKLTERVPVAVWRDSKGISYVIDEEGRPIIEYVSGDKFKNLLLLIGENANVGLADVLSIIEINRAFAQNIISLKRVGSRRWDIKVNSGAEILLPEEGYLDAWRRAIDIMESNDASAIARIDLRIAGKVFFTMKNNV